MEPEHLRFDQRRKMYTKGDCWQGKNSNCVPDGRFGCFACNMWSYVSTWRASVDDGRVNNRLSNALSPTKRGFSLSLAIEAEAAYLCMCNRLRG